VSVAYEAAGPRRLTAADRLGGSMRVGSQAMADAADEEDRDWRVRAELSAAGSDTARRLLERFRGAHVLAEAAAAVGEEVVLTHDGNVLFLYAADEPSLRAAQSALAQALRADSVTFAFTVSHWDEATEEWAQVEPPLTGARELAHEQAVKEAEAPDQKTFVVRVGKEIRSEFEASMQNWAGRLGLSCQIVEHPHLLSTQVAFTVSGTSRHVEEFRQGLAAEEFATIRTERVVQASPL
jgi:hypothetical protein